MRPAAAAPPNFWSACGAAACDSAAIERFYEEYSRIHSTAVAPERGGRDRELERLAGGPHAVDPLLKAFLNAGYTIHSADIRDFSKHLHDPGAVWLYTEPQFAGAVRQFRTGSAMLPGDAAYRSIRVGARVYAQLYSAGEYAGARLAAYSSIANLAEAGFPFAPRSLKLAGRAEITVTPVHSPETRKGAQPPVIGVAARVSLTNLDVDLATLRQQCDTPCYDSSCPPDAGFFYDPVYPVYDPKAADRAWFGKWPMQLMINTSYFKLCQRGRYHQARCANSSGLMVKDGRKLLDENVRDDFGNLLDAIVFWQDGRVELFLNNDIPKDLSRAEVALGGNWFFDGERYECGACHGPDTRQPRTALGLDEDNQTLIIVVIQPGNAARGQSLTGRELHALMRQMGVARGFMLDGGGSSQFVYVREGGEPVWAVPPGDREGYRPIPSAFGIAGRKDLPAAGR